MAIVRSVLCTPIFTRITLSTPCAIAMTRRAARLDALGRSTAAAGRDSYDKDFSCRKRHCGSDHHGTNCIRHPDCIRTISEERRRRGSGFDHLDSGMIHSAGRTHSCARPIFLSTIIHTVAESASPRAFRACRVADSINLLEARHAHSCIHVVADYFGTPDWISYYREGSEQ